MTEIPEWITSQRRDRGICEICGQDDAATIWAGNGQDICWSCCEAKRAEGED
jgi:hypothetical protein